MKKIAILDFKKAFDTIAHKALFHNPTKVIEGVRMDQVLPCQPAAVGNNGW